MVVMRSVYELRKRVKRRENPSEHVNLHVFYMYFARYCMFQRYLLRFTLLVAFFVVCRSA